ncbi:MAG: iron-only hydrogenase system regulator [Eubacteriales bacterium]|nr:iron-only hydrogenase system regulator [Eubacteriales bacterium]
MESRIAVVGIALEDRTKSSQAVNEILGSYGDMIVGRLGIPYRDRNISIISVIVDGSNDEIGALTGKLGNLKGVKTKVSVMY